MKQLFYFLCFSLLVIGACKKGDDTPEITDPSITLSANVDLSQSICVGVPIEIKVDLKTNANVGIKTFSIVKNGSETLVEESTIVSNNLLYTFNYVATQEDLAAGNVEFSFTLSDKEEKVTNEILLLPVVNQFAYLKEMAAPNPSWDLVKNEAVAAADGSNVDIFLKTDVEGCGFGCVRYRFTFTSKNETRFYSLPYNTVVTPHRNDLKQAKLLSEIAGITPVKELIVYSTFPNDITATGELNNLPVVAQIRGTEEYALIERVSSAPGQYFYRKTSANAGE